MSNHLYDVIEAAVASPEQCFIETEAGRVITYSDMVAERAKIANLLCALGVAAGGRVACQVEKRADALLLYIACRRGGAVSKKSKMKLMPSKALLKAPSLASSSQILAMPLLPVL